MATALPTVKVLKSVYSPAYEHADSTFTPYKAGMIKVVTSDNPATLVYRTRNQPGGLLEVRGPGEKITTKTGGLSYFDEEANTYNFSDGRATTALEMYGLQNPESLNPSDMQNVGVIALQQMDELMAEVSNTMRLMASLAFIPSITIDNVTFENKKILQSDISGSSPWTAYTTTDIIAYLTTLKKDFFGPNLSASGITVMVPSKQVDSIARNQFIQKTIGFDTGSNQIPSYLAFAKAQELFRGYGISIIEWNDAYYNTSNSGAYDNLSTFLDPDHISVIPNAYFDRVPGSFGNYTSVGPQSVTPAFIDLIVVPDPDFINKRNRRSGGLPTSMGSVNGAYVFSGFVDDGPDTPDAYKTYVATRMGLFLEKSLMPRYIKVS